MPLQELAKTLPAHSLARISSFEVCCSCLRRVLLGIVKPDLSLQRHGQQIDWCIWSASRLSMNGMHTHMDTLTGYDLLCMTGWLDEMKTCGWAVAVPQKRP